MKLGLMFVNSGPFSNPALLTHLATTAERCGIESMWTVEHVVIPQDYKSPYPYSSTGKIPGRRRRLRFPIRCCRWRLRLR